MLSPVTAKLDLTDLPAAASASRTQPCPASVGCSCQNRGVVCEDAQRSLVSMCEMNNDKCRQDQDRRGSRRDAVTNTGFRGAWRVCFVSEQLPCSAQPLVLAVSFPVKASASPTILKQSRAVSS